MCRNVDALGAKEMVMGMVSHGNSDVRMQALLAIQKMMVQNWLVYTTWQCTQAYMPPSHIYTHAHTHTHAQGIFRSAADRGYGIHIQDCGAALNMSTVVCTRVLFCRAASVVHCRHHLSITASLHLSGCYQRNAPRTS